MEPKIIQNDNFIEVIGHYDNEVQCAKMTLLAELYAVDHRDGYAKFPLNVVDKLWLVDDKLKFRPTESYIYTYDGTVLIEVIQTSDSGNYSWLLRPDGIYNDVGELIVPIESFVGLALQPNGEIVQPVSNIKYDHAEDETAYYAKTQTSTGYSITYHANGGTPTPTDLTGQTNLPNPLPTVSKTNFSFDGWYYDNEFQNEAHTGDELSADVDLYAKFTRTHITLDLSTIGLPAGTHSIQMKLSDDGVTKADSALSNAVQYTVSSGHTLTIQNNMALENPIKVEYANGNIEEVVFEEGMSIQNIHKILKIGMMTCGFARLRNSLTGSDADFTDYVVGLNNNIGWVYDNCPVNFEFILTKDIVINYFDPTCLASSTLVYTDSGHKEIKDINVDTLLLTYNEETKQNEYKRVTKWWHHPSSDLVTINDNLFTMTGDHPIYINDYEVVKGREVKVGDFLIDKDGNKVLVEKVEFSKEPIEVYMIEVEDNHNFYITDKNLLSHNY